MRIVGDCAKGTIIVMLTGESDLITSRIIVENVSLGDLLRFKRREGAGADSPLSDRMKLYFTAGNKTVSLSVESCLDESQVRQIHADIHIGKSAGLVFAGHHDVKEVSYLEFKVSHCNVCKKPKTPLGDCGRLAIRGVKDRCKHVCACYKKRK